MGGKPPDPSTVAVEHFFLAATYSPMTHTCLNSHFHRLSEYTSTYPPPLYLTQKKLFDESCKKCRDPPIFCVLSPT